MKRNMDLIRALLLAVERDDKNLPEIAKKFSPAEVAYNAALIIEAGLAEGVIHTHASGRSIALT